MYDRFDCAIFIQENIWQVQVVICFHSALETGFGPATARAVSILQCAMMYPLNNAAAATAAVYSVLCCTLSKVRRQKVLLLFVAFISLWLFHSFERYIKQETCCCWPGGTGIVFAPLDDTVKCIWRTGCRLSYHII